MESLETKNILKSESFNRTSINDEVSSIVKSSCNIQIGDSSSIIKTSSFEENMKEAVNSFHSITNESNNITEAIFIDGQGDANIKSVSESSIVNELITAEVIHSRNEIDSKFRKETVEESSCFLRNIIEQLEKQESESKIQEIKKKILNPVIKEEIAIWEENEEELIRVIDAPDIYNNNIDDEEKNEFFEQSIGEMIFIGEEPELLSSLLSKVSSSKVEYVEEIEIEEVGSFPLFLDSEESKSLPAPPTKFPLPQISAGSLELKAKDNCNTHKSEKPKKWFSNKLRKFFNFSFGRNKY